MLEEDSSRRLEDEVTKEQGGVAYKTRAGKQPVASKQMEKSENKHYKE